MAFTFHYYPRTSGSGHSGSGFKASWPQPSDIRGQAVMSHAARWDMPVLVSYL